MIVTKEKVNRLAEVVPSIEQFSEGLFLLLNTVVPPGSAGGPAEFWQAIDAIRHAANDLRSASVWLERAKAAYQR